MKRVVITGIGSVTPYGFGVDVFWNSILERKNAISYIQELELFGDIVKIGTMLPQINKSNERKIQTNQKPLRNDEMCFLNAVYEAIDNADFYNVLDNNTDNILVSIADRKPGLVSMIDELSYMFPKISISSYPDDIYYKGLIDFFSRKKDFDKDSINHLVSREFNITGPQLSIATACASGNNAIGETYLKIKSGLIEAGITGGAYSLDLNSMIGFSRLGALSTNPDPNRACKPFDKSRDGFVMGSGCGVLILEELDQAKKRGVNILCEVAGYSLNCDALRATDSDPEAKGATRAILEVLKMASIKKEEINYINAHGTSTKMNDHMETIAIKQAFGRHAYNIAVSSTKSLIGHSIMAAAALEGIICVKSILSNTIHGTNNLQESEAELDLDYVPEASRKLILNYALSNSFGFGGQNSVILFKKYIP